MSLPVFYINLDRSIYRNNRMKKCLDEINANYERIQGVDMNFINKNALMGGECDGLKYKIKQNVIFHPRQKEIAIILSHLKALTQLIEKNYDIAIIMEDDLSFRYIENWDEQISKIIETAPKNWSILKLHTSTPNIVEKYGELYKKQNINFMPLVKESIQSAGCYIINKEAAIKIINKYKINEIYTFPHDKEYCICECIIFSIPNVYIYTLPIICVAENNVTCNNNYNRADTSTNKIIHSFWESFSNNNHNYNKIDICTESLTPYNIKTLRERFIKKNA
jgi:GR25 family glycosyltransferase involved in LPS biosynthesis